jgi:hypothetical protein
MYHQYSRLEITRVKKVQKSGATALAPGSMLIPKMGFFGRAAASARLRTRIPEVLEVSTSPVQRGVALVAQRDYVPQLVRPAEAGLEHVVRSPLKGTQPPGAVLAAAPREAAEPAPHRSGFLALGGAVDGSRPAADALLTDGRGREKGLPGPEPHPGGAHGGGPSREPGVGLACAALRLRWVPRAAREAQDREVRPHAGDHCCRWHGSFYTNKVQKL